MTLLPSLGAWVDAGSGLLLLALGAYVASVRPRRRVNSSFAVFSACLGLGFFLSNVMSNDDPASPALDFLGWGLMAPATAALAAIGLLFPQPLPPPRARILALPGIAALAGLLVSLGTSTNPNPAFHVGSNLINAGFWFILLLLPLRFRAAPPASPERRHHVLMAAALAMFPGLAAGFQATLYAARWRAGDWQTNVPVAMVLLLLAAALWLRNAGASQGRDARTSRDLGLLSVLLPLCGMVLTVAQGSSPAASNGGMFGLARVLTVLLLAYAILRHQLLGLDLKVKWTIKQSTLAAAFVAVFFVVSESASSFLATEGGLGRYLGIAAAGLLVFAIAPLQRAAERVASAAMPQVRAPAELSQGERLEFYRDQLRLAYGDGVVDGGERVLLQGARAKLGISAEDAERLEREVLAARRAPP